MKKYNIYKIKDDVGADLGHGIFYHWCFNINEVYSLMDKWMEDDRRCGAHSSYEIRESNA